ncbi:Gfo/Idh/MocA family oxidoreductase [bacterium]|nr:Gfo/Idh/MocA family oxidoreductase [bacterium]
MKRTLGVALLGAGVVGQLRARVIAAHPASQLLGVADPDVGAARRAAGQARVVADYRPLLEDPAVGAVVVATPAPLHFSMCMDALEAGKHVLCEKPLAPSSEECRQLVDRAKALGKVLAVGFNHRYYPCIKVLKAALPSLGDVQHVRALCGHRGMSEFRADWNYRAELSGGGAMMDLGIHLTDLVGHLFGDIVKVFGTASNRVWQIAGSEDHAVAMFTTSRDIPIAYHASWAEWKGYRLILEVYGSHGVARAFYAPMLNMQVRRCQGRPSYSWNLHPWVNVREKLFGWETTAQIAFAEEFQDFIGALDGHPGACADGAAGWRAVEVARAVYESSQTGSPVNLA